MEDWLGRLSPEEKEEWDKFVHHSRTELVSKLAESAMVMSLVPDKPDVKFAVELGFAIMLDKPVVAVVQKGGTIPGKLRLVADWIIEVSDLDTEEGQREFSRQLDPILTSMHLLDEDPS